MLNRLKFSATVFLIVVAAMGCKDESDPKPAPAQNTDHAYMGNWGGDFVGGDNGTWTMTVDKDGKFTGEAYSNNSQSYMPITGSIDDKGVLDAEINASGVILDFTGQGQNADTVSGTWGNPSINITGTWTGGRR